MTRFGRSFAKNISEALCGSELFENKLKGDIGKGTVFPAFRNDVVDFYYRGGNLFKYSREGFSTHVKYASVLKGYDKPYISDHGFTEDVRLIKSFEEGYNRIKENCDLYAGVESAGVSKIYHRSGYACSQEDVVVLDIEVSMPILEGQATPDAESTLDSEWKDEVDPKGEKRKQDRIDLLLYDTKQRVLRFYEAKHITNPENWSQRGSSPPVAKQLRRYNAQLSDPRRNKEILKAYQGYVSIANDFFGLKMPIPETLEKEVVLWVFGFDKYQKGKLDDLLIGDGSLKGLKFRFISNPKYATDLWKEVKQGNDESRK